jgi:uncharacterized protein YndB with AHSA1/START domain
MVRVIVLGLVLTAPFVSATAHAEEEPLPPPPIVISAPRVEVWAALTTVEGILATEGGQATVDLRPGGAIRRHADAKAEPLAPGWTSTPVLAFVAPRILILGEETPATWTSIELDELDPLRTRVRIEHAGIAAGVKVAAAAEEHDAAFVARLAKRFPAKPDPVVAAWTSLVGIWEERSEAGREVLARWTIAFDTSDGPGATDRTAISLERRAEDDGSVDRWVFWRQNESGRWIEWSNRWSDLGSRAFSIETPPHDGVVEMEIIEGCIGRAFRWTRAAEPK